MPDQFLQHLNKAQREAVEKILGTVLVIAGPGTGKTQVLTSRIANILRETDAGPESILCLTFTESGAVEMRNRLQKWIGAAAYKVSISTFHGFCEGVLQDYSELFFKDGQSFSVADDLQKALVFRKVIDSSHWKYLKPFGDNYFWQRSFLSAVSHLKRENVSPFVLRDKFIPAERERLENDPANFYLRDSKFGKKGEMKSGVLEKIEARVGRMLEFCDVWKAYDKALFGRRLYDFDDQIQMVVKAVSENEELKLDLQEKYQFILVDEYQDTNSAQNEILWHLSDFEKPNLFVVGDDDQSIYRFQGASLENILAFRDRFSGSEVISLTENYRSASVILEAAFGVVGNNIERIDSEKMLVASGENKDVVGVLERAVFPSRFSEIVFLAEKIQGLLDGGTKASEIAVLVRENKEVREVAEYFGKFKIPVSARLFENVFEVEAVKFLVLMLRVFDDPSLDYAFFELLHAPFLDIENKEIYALSLKTKGGRVKVGDVLLESAEDSGVKRVFNLFVKANREYRHLLPHLVAEKLFHDFGLAEYLAREENPNRISDLLKVRKFFEWVELNPPSPPCQGGKNLDFGEKGLKMVLERVDLHLELGIGLFPDPLPAEDNAVQVMTAHRAKGMEFEVVFLPGLVDKVWGNCRKKMGMPLPHLFVQDHDGNEDERRLFFVAMTRAKRQLFLSYAGKDFSGKERGASLFWHEVPEKCVVDVEIEDSLEQKVQELLPVFFATPDAPVLTSSEREILVKLVDEFVWSATSLQAFLDSPRDFLYSRLLRVPRPGSKFFGFGIAVHFALQRFFESFKASGVLPGKDVLLGFFVDAIKRQSLSKVELENALRHGEEVLGNYFDAKSGGFSNNVLVEFDFGVVKFGDIAVTGKVDRVDLLGDNCAKLVDYKSGKPGRVKEGERLWRQMVFYDLLSREKKGLGFEVESVVLEFLTPGLNKKFVQEEVRVGDEDRERVLGELREADRRLRGLEFFDVDLDVGDVSENYTRVRDEADLRNVVGLK